MILSVRDRIAFEALFVLLSQKGIEAYDLFALATEAYGLADALIAARG